MNISPAPSEPPRSLRRWALDRLDEFWTVARANWRRVAELIGSIIILVVFQRYMLRLSGGALWLPKEWGDSITIMSLLFASVVFAHLQDRRIAISRGRHAATLDSEAHPSAGPHRGPLQLDSAAKWFVIAIIGLSAYIWLRAGTMIKWDLSDWEAEMVEVVPDADGHPRPGKCGVEWSSIIDAERCEIFVPLWWPPEIKEGIELRAKMDREPSGLLDYLQNDLHKFLDLLHVHARAQYAWTILCFLCAHLVILAGAAGTLAYSLSVLEALVDLNS